MGQTKRFPKLSSPAILSPMAGVTDVAFRTLCKRYGAGMTCTEFVSSAALVRDNRKTEELLVTDSSERPVAVQLFGNSEKEVVAAARRVAPSFDVIDINCGCPAWKVIRIGAGSAMLNEPQRIARLVRLLTEAVDKPVTVKIRAGLDAQHINAVAVAQACESAGAAAIAVHGRTAAQGYSGSADWNLIRKVKESVGIPVIGNGDVFSPETFVQRLEESGVDAILVARGAIGNPRIFAQIADYRKGRSYEAANPRQEFLAYLALAEKYRIPFGQVKGHAMSFTKGMQGGARIRERLARCKDMKELRGSFGPSPRNI